MYKLWQTVRKTRRVWTEKLREYLKRWWRVSHRRVSSAPWRLAAVVKDCWRWAPSRWPPPGQMATKRQLKPLSMSKIPRRQLLLLHLFLIPLLLLLLLLQWWCYCCSCWSCGCFCCSPRRRSRAAQFWRYCRLRQWTIVTTRDTTHSAHTEHE